MATKLFLKNTTTNGFTGTGDGVVYDMNTIAGASSDTGVVTLTNGGTEIQWTKTAGGLSMAWISGRVPAGGWSFTSSDVSVWLQESNANDEAGGRLRLYKYSILSQSFTELLGGPFDDGVEMDSMSPTEMTWVCNANDTDFDENDRILIRLFATNITTMTAGTATLTFNAADAATGDSFFNIAETIVFKPVQTAALTGTVTASITETDIVTGGKTIILTLSNEEWVAAGATFDAQRQNIINGLDSVQSEATGWDAVVKAGQGVSGVVRTSNTVVTITLDAFATYNITATETITATIPATALASKVAIVASPTFTISTAAEPPAVIFNNTQFFQLTGVGL